MHCNQHPQQMQLPNPTTPAQPPALEMSPEMESKAVGHIVLMLNGMRARFAILLPNGHVYGDLPIAPPETPKGPNGKARKVYRFSPGTFKSVYEPYLRDLQIGQIANVPFGEFPPDSMRSAMAAYACHAWGNKSAITNIKRDVGMVELMRTK